MTDSKHTPGPWAVRGSIKSVDGDDLYVGYVLPDVKGYRGDVCSVQSADHISGITRDEAAANASLIASAPDLLAERDRLREVNSVLLAALEAACEEIKYLRDWANNHGAMYDEERFTEGLAAIAKAKEMGL